MAMTTKLWSLNSLATEVGVNIRTLGRALSGTQPDGELNGHPAYYLRTALSALAARDRAGGGGDATLDELERTAVDVDRLLEQLRTAGGVEEVRRILRAGGGRCLGRLDALMQVTAGDRRPAERELLDRFRSHVVGRILGEVLELANWQDAILADSPSTSDGRT
jgi:hypothetical protein